MIKYTTEKSEVKELMEAILRHKKNENSTIGETSLDGYNIELAEYSITPTVIKDLVTEKAVLDYHKIKEAISLLADYKKMDVHVFDEELNWVLNSKQSFTNE